MVIVVRIDLDKYSLAEIRAFVMGGIITISEANESGAFKRMSEWDQVKWVRAIQVSEKVG